MFSSTTRHTLPIQHWQKRDGDRTVPFLPTQKKTYCKDIGKRHPTRRAMLNIWIWTCCSQLFFPNKKIQKHPNKTLRIWKPTKWKHFKNTRFFPTKNMIDVRIAEFRIRRRSQPQRFFTAVLGERGGLDHLRDPEAHVVRRGDRLRLARGDQHRGSGWVCSPWISVFLKPRCRDNPSLVGI